MGIPLCDVHGLIQHKLAQVNVQAEQGAARERAAEERGRSLEEQRSVTVPLLDVWYKVVMWLYRKRDRERQSQELQAKEEALVSLAEHDGCVCSDLFSCSNND